LPGGRQNAESHFGFSTSRCTSRSVGNIGIAACNKVPLSIVPSKGKPEFKPASKPSGKRFRFMDGPVPFYLQPVTLDLVAAHAELIASIKGKLTTGPALVVLDTLNRSLRGSENDSKDMAAYIAAADAIREAFNCAVAIVHHCGIDGTRPRGSTALSGAVDAQLSVKRDASDAIIVEVEFQKDGAPGEIIASRLTVVEVGKDLDGEIISSCVVTAADVPKIAEAGPKLTRNQQTMFSLLHGAGAAGLSTEQWNEQARKVDIGTKRKADLYDIREALKSKGLVRQYGDRWNVC
jgi:hypothetical protein